MRGWLTAVLGRGLLQGAITGVDAGNIMRSFVGRVVDMAEQGEACLTNRRDRATNASMWRIEWKRRTARWQIENVLLFGSDEERQAVREAIEACGIDILSLDAATEGQLTAALESLKKSAAKRGNRAGGPEVPEVFAVILMAAIQIPNSEWEDSAVKRNKFERS
jgi:hypothetical protein